MRIIELLILLVDLAYLALLLVPALANARWVSFLPAGALVLVVLHVLVEKPRWQMIPIYALTVLFVVLASAAMARPALDRPPSTGWAIAGLVVLLLAALLPSLVPVPQLPPPGGPYAVGTTVFDWTDPNRTEIYPPTAGSPRRILVQVWYPAVAAPGLHHEPYLRDLARIYPAIAKENGIPAFAFAHVLLARTNSLTDAPSAEGRFPVLVFSHGWTGFRAQNTYQMEALASRGYIVFSADHTYGAAAVAFPGSPVAYNYPDALPSNVSTEEYDAAARKLGLTFVGDIRFVLDQAARIETGEIASPLAGKLDLAQVGIFGHSTGAGAAVETCYVDARCKAGLTEDAWLIPYSREMVSAGLSQPFLMMSSETWQAKRNPPLQAQLFQNLKSDAYHLSLKGTNHYSFSDISLFLPLISRISSGSLFRQTPQQIINAYTIDFFDHYLKGQPAGLLDANSAPLPSVTIERRTR
jgi:predicted dienelactone hydrolase